jgi:hypothetical protein
VQVAGASVGLTALRPTLCSGSSMVMKPALPRRRSPITRSCSLMASRLARPMPCAEENDPWSVSTAMMSFHLVIDQ